MFSPGIVGSLGVLLGGIGYATVHDVQVNAAGCAVALASAVVTALQQVRTGEIQKRLDVSSSQLLLHSSPTMGCFLLVTGPFIDYGVTGTSLLAFPYTRQVVGCIALSCLIAIGVNMGTFAVIGKLDAVTYQVIGHFKTIIILFFGFYFLGNKSTDLSLHAGLARSSAQHRFPAERAGNDARNFGILQVSSRRRCVP